MIKTIQIISLSSGILGEKFIKHELNIGLARLQEYGLNVKFSEHALMGIDYIKNHPEERANDLIRAFSDEETDMILCAIGGDDTYRLLPYLFENDVLKKAVKNKIFLGFSDTTINHLMLHKVGLNTFYGQAFLSDLCEMDKEMLPYTKKYFEELIHTGTISEITPSDCWHEERKDFGTECVGTPTPKHPNGGFELLQGSPVFEGKILGGCLDTIYDIFDGTRYADMPDICRKYSLFPSLEDWKGKIMLLETSEERMLPEKFRIEIRTLEQTGVFDVISGLIVGKPIDEMYYDEYRQILTDELSRKEISIVYNLNIGHSAPRCIIPFGVEAEVNATRQRIRFI